MGDLASTPKPEINPIGESVKAEGCSHYKRNCKLVSPCCGKEYVCRLCHDENEDHTINRKEVTEVICSLCELRQPVSEKCQKCEVVFGKYTCLICNLFDNEDKNQFHCEGCGICRIGGRDKFFHCPKCNMCLPLQLENNHRCVENVSRANCPVCLEDIHTSRMPCHIPHCGHLLHRLCFEQLIHSGMYACPVCQISLLDMSEVWEHLDNDIADTPMPDEYSNVIVEILCKDCHKKSVVKFHVLGHKCTHCGSYNSCRIKAERVPATVPDTANEENSGEGEDDDVEADNDTSDNATEELNRTI